MVYDTPSYESIYTGSYSPLDPKYGPLFTGYRVPVSQLGMTTDPRTANIIGEVSAKLSQGVKTFELSQVSPQVFESIPKQHWKEVERLGKLTGVNFTLHGPILDPAGFTREGWSESNREQVENQFKNVTERAHVLSPEGNIPITIHATGGIPSTLAPKPETAPITQEDMFYVVNRESGQVTGIRREKKYIPEEAKEIWLGPKEQLKEANKKMWDRTVGSIAWEDVRAREIISETAPTIQPILESMGVKEISKIKEEQILPEQQKALGVLKMGQVIYADLGAHIKTFYNDAKRLWPEKIKKKYEKELVEIRDNLAEIESKNLIETNPLEASRRYDRIIRKFHNLVKKEPPQIYVPTDQFAMEQSKKTIANVALDSYRKYGENAPILSVENVFPNTVFGRAEELAGLIKASREEFVERAKKQGISENKAREAAEKLIGATWDISHINMIRKYGFPKKAVVEETKKIAPFVKHVHLSDNFGFEHTELPPGMGNVPTKEMLEELEKKGFSGKKILEFASWAEHFKVSPIPYLFEAMGSPLYGMDMQPFWNQVRNVYGIPAGYFGGYGYMLPEQHYAIYGAGFATLPLELGGKMPGKGQRFSGTPME